jgi:hypothetical protein
VGFISEYLSVFGLIWKVTCKTCDFYFSFYRITMNRRNVGAEGDDVVFGTNPVLLALRQRRRNFFRLFITEAKSLSQEPQVQEILKLCQQLKIRILRKEAVQLAKLSENRPHQVRPSPLVFSHFFLRIQMYRIFKGVCLDTTTLTPTPLDMSTLKTEIDSGEQRKPLLWLFLDSVMVNMAPNFMTSPVEIQIFRSYGQ